jgi:predicted DNA-binding WGR domain protein
MPNSVPTCVRRFEFLGGNSSKFWEVSVSAKDVTVCFGRIGTAGQKQSKSLVNEAKAAEHTEKLVRAKLAKGYKEVSTPKAA